MKLMNWKQIISHARDWHFGSMRGGIVEVSMSEAQWAHFVSSVGQGGGVPCTLETVGTERMDRCPEQHEMQRFSEDAKREAAKASAFLDEAIKQLHALAQEKAPSKAKREEVLALVKWTKQKLADSMPWVARQLNERMAAIVLEGKTELEAYAQRTLIESGLTELAKLTGRPAGMPMQLPDEVIDVETTTKKEEP